MATLYTAEILDAGLALAQAGTSVTFTRTVETYDPATDTSVPVVSTSTGSGIRVRARGTDIMRLQAPGLVVVDPVTLLVAGQGLAFDPLPGDTFAWGQFTYSVRFVDPVAPDGTSILLRVVGSR